MNSALRTDLQTEGASDLSHVHLVHVVRQYLPSIGGLEEVVRNLAARQTGRFASVKIVTLDRLFRDPGTVLPRHEVVEGIDIVRIPYYGSSRYPFAPAVLKEIGGADLVHVHAVDFFFDALALTRPWHGRKLVATTHGGFFHTKKLARLKAVWFNTLTRLSAGRYAGLACCSESDLELFGKIAADRVHLIENGVDLDKFRDAAAATPRKRMLAIARFSSNKRLERLVELMAELDAQDPEWRLDIAGMEADLTARDLEARAAALGLESKITVHVGLPQEDLRSLIGKCSLFVSASDYEGFGLVLIEALSAGLIPVVQANGSFTALARELADVRLADFGNPKDTCRTILSTMQALTVSPDLRSGAMRSVERFGWPLVAKEYDALYRQALSR